MIMFKITQAHDWSMLGKTHKSIFPKKRPWTFLSDPFTPSRETSIPKNPWKSIIFQIEDSSFGMLSVVRGTRGWAYFRFSSSEDMPCSCCATNEISAVQLSGQLTRLFLTGTSRKKRTAAQ